MAQQDGEAAAVSRGGRHLGVAGRIKRAAPLIWMNVLVGTVLGVAALVAGLPALQMPDPMWSIRAVTAFAIWVLSFVPGWLYVRFLGLRADALWNEYVLNLYRLGVDEPASLPPPPAESTYARLPGAAEGGREKYNIYRQKFNAYYGRNVSARAGDSENFRVSVDTLFPIFLCTATLAVAWSVILWEPNALMSGRGQWATLEFGFLGAYAFATSMLVRRFYQSDLRPSAYAAVVLRIVLVLLILTVLHQVFAVEGADSDLARAAQYATAFVVGFFPLAGLQALQRVAANTLRGLVPQLAPDYPLEHLDGLNIWYEARLAEEGVEDMQNLTTMNLVDVILHTRAPVGRLIDWIDQAFLLIHLDPDPRGSEQAPAAPGDPAGNATTRVALRRMGVRSATDLLTAFGPCADQDSTRDLNTTATDRLRARGLDPDQIETLVRLLAAEPGLDPVWNWKDGGAGRTVRRQSQGVAEAATQRTRRPTSPVITSGRTGEPHRIADRSSERQRR
jgi:hypothetical protein